MSFSATLQELINRSKMDLVKVAPHWERVELGAACDIINGFAFKSRHFSEYGRIKLIRIRDVTTGTCSTYYSGPAVDGYDVADGDLLVGMDGDFNSRLWMGGSGLLNQRVCKLVPNEAYLDKRFVAYALPGYLKLINDETHSVTVKHLSSETLSELPFPLPPFGEQRRIVAKVDSLFAKTKRARAQLGHIPHLIERYKQAILAAAFRGDLTNGWRAARQLQDPWPWLTARELFSWSSGKNLPKKKHKDGDIPVFGGNGISGRHDVANVHHQTIVIGRVGALCGNVYLTAGPAWVTDNAIFASQIDKRINPKFARLVFQMANLNKKAGGTGQPYVNQTILNAVALPLPCEAEQAVILERIGRTLKWADRIAREHDGASRLIERLDQAVLANAFKGELVPQDPNDEPASALLERIHGERAKRNLDKGRRSDLTKRPALQTPST